jgi:hypothetical protein
MTGSGQRSQGSAGRGVAQRRVPETRRSVRRRLQLSTEAEAAKELGCIRLEELPRQEGNRITRRGVPSPLQFSEVAGRELERLTDILRFEIRVVPEELVRSGYAATPQRPAGSSNARRGCKATRSSVSGSRLFDPTGRPARLPHPARAAGSTAVESPLALQSSSTAVRRERASFRAEPESPREDSDATKRITCEHRRGGGSAPSNRRTPALRGLSSRGGDHLAGSMLRMALMRQPSWARTKTKLDHILRVVAPLIS